MVEVIAALPRGWRLVRLVDVADTALGKMLDRGRPKNLPQVPYLRNVNVQWGRIDAWDVHTMELGEDERERFAVRVGDLLACEGGEVGRAAIWRGGDGYLAYQKAVHRVRSKGDLELPYLRYLLEFYSANGTLRRFSTGSTIAHLPQQNFRQLPVPLPAPTEQRRIVDLLEEHLSRLDAGVDGCKDAVAKMVAMRRSLWQQTFVGTAASDRWPHVSLLDVVQIANGQTPKGLAERMRRRPGADSVPFFKVGDMNSSDGRMMAAARYFVDRPDARSLGLHIRSAGTVLIPKRGGAIATNKKRILPSDAAYDLNTMGFEPSDRISAHFLWHWLEGIDLDQLADGSNVPQLNAPQIRGLVLPLPDRSTQAAVVERLDEQYGRVDRLGSGLGAVRRRSDGLRSAVLAAAFSGRLTGRTSDLAVARV